MTRLRFLTCCAILSAAPAPALELEGSLGVGSEWSEVSSQARQDPGFFARPAVALWDDDGQLSYRVDYEPLFRYFLDDRGTEGWSHQLSGRGTWMPGPTTTLSISDRFLRTRSASLFNALVGEGDPGADEQVRLVTGQRRTLSNSLDASLVQSLTRTHSLTVGAGHDWFEDEGREQESLSAELGWRRARSETESLGAGLHVARHRFQLLEGSAQRTDFVGLRGVWARSVDPSLAFHLALGPLLVLPHEHPEGEGDRITLFADLGLRKSWKRVTGTLAYRRGAGATSSLGSSTIDDVISASLVWQPSRRWRIRLASTYRHQSTENAGHRPVQRTGSDARSLLRLESAADREDLESDTVTVRLGVGYDLRERLELRANAFYLARDIAGIADREVRIDVGLVCSFASLRL